MSDHKLSPFPTKNNPPSPIHTSRLPPLFFRLQLPDTVHVQLAMIYFLLILVFTVEMELLTGRGLNKQIQTILKDQVESQCCLCLGQFDIGDYAPMMMCMNQHSCCAPCMQQLLKNQAKALVNCPHCNAPIVKKAVAKNRLLITIYQLVKAFKKHAVEMEEEMVEMKKMSTIDMKTSLLSRNPRMVNSFILGLENPNKLLRDSTLLDDAPTFKSHTWIGSSQKRKDNLLAYAQRQKIDQLKKIARSQIPFDEITKIRSGYGSIKKIECMQYFTNLRQLLLYNNNIKQIEGLNNNLKLNVLSLAYNKIEKVQNISQLKQLKRLSIQCNKITKNSAQFMLLYDWKNLQSLTISFHHQSKDDNDDCFVLMFGTKCTTQWANLKNLYIYNSKNVGDRGRTVVREFTNRRKVPLQVYWS